MNNRNEKSPVFRVQISSDKLNHNVKAGYNGSRRVQPEPVFIPAPKDGHADRLEYEIRELRAMVEQSSAEIALNRSNIANLDQLRSELMTRNEIK